MSFMRKMERKFGRYAIKNLSLYMTIGYVIGYLLYMFAPGILEYMTLIPAKVMQGEVWRLFTWVITPPDSLGIFTVIMLYFYYSIGTKLEFTLGAFLYNIYIFGGILITMIGSMLTYIICHYALYMPEAIGYFPITTYYILLTIFLAIAVCYPNMTVLYAMIIPIKMKWLSIVYLVLAAYDFKRFDYIMLRANIILSLVSFFIFYISTRNLRKISPKNIKRRRDYAKQVKANITDNVIHRCAVCGITDKDAPDMKFRYCSKCSGNKEYCEQHLFTHTHV